MGMDGEVTASEIRAALAKYNVRAAFLVQDRLPREWRELVYAHGQIRVLRLYERGYDWVTAKRFLGSSAGPVVKIKVRSDRRG